MFYEPRQAIFVVVSTDHGTMIVNRKDYEVDKKNVAITGVGNDLLCYSHYDAPQIGLLIKFLEMRRESFGDGVVAVDGGANIGTYALAFGKAMTGWGSVLAFEPYKWSYRPLCGNICICNCFNVEPLQMALGKADGVVPIGQIDPTTPHNFGGISLRDTSGRLDETAVCTLDSFNLDRLDLLKLDIEGMELEALEGAQKTIRRCKPILCVEHIFCGIEALERAFARFGYRTHPTGMNSVAIHEDDPVGKRIQWYDSEAGEAA